MDRDGSTRKASRSSSSVIRFRLCSKAFIYTWAEIQHQTIATLDKILLDNPTSYGDFTLRIRSSKFPVIGKTYIPQTKRDNDILVVAFIDCPLSSALSDSCSCLA